LLAGNFRSTKVHETLIEPLKKSGDYIKGCWPEKKDNKSSVEPSRRNAVKGFAGTRQQKERKTHNWCRLLWKGREKTKNQRRKKKLWRPREGTNLGLVDEYRNQQGRQKKEVKPALLCTPTRKLTTGFSKGSKKAGEKKKEPASKDGKIVATRSMKGLWTGRKRDTDHYVTQQKRGRKRRNSKTDSLFQFPGENDEKTRRELG